MSFREATKAGNQGAVTRQVASGYPALLRLLRPHCAAPAGCAMKAHKPSLSVSRIATLSLQGTLRRILGSPSRGWEGGSGLGRR